MKRTPLGKTILLVWLLSSVLIASSIVAPLPTQALNESDFEAIWIKNGYFAPSFTYGIAQSSEGLVRVPKDYKWGFMDTLGTETIPQIYDQASDFSEGLAAVCKGGACGFIDRTGRLAIPMNYTGTSSFQEGLAAVRKNDKWGYVNKSGELVIPFLYERAESFREGRAAVKKDGKWGYIDQNGKAVVSPAYDEAHAFYEGLAAVRKGQAWGYVNLSGKEAISCRYEDANHFQEGMAAVMKDGKWGYIDKTGKVAIPFVYAYTSVFSEGLADVTQSGKWGFINKKGALTISLSYDEVGSFREGLAAVKKEGRWGYINQKGVPILPIAYDEQGSYRIGDFYEGVAVVVQAGKWGVVDRSGNIVVPLIYDRITDFREGVAIFKKDGKWGLLRNKTYQPSDSIYESYIYDTTDAGDSVTLPVAELEKVTDASSAASAVKTAATALTKAQKESSVGVDLLTLYSEAAVSESASRAVTGGTIAVSKTSIDPLKKVSEQTKATVEKTIQNAGIEIQRALGTDVQFSTTSEKIVINVDPTTVKAGVDNVKVETPNYAVTLPTEALKKNVGNTTLVITVKEVKQGSSVGFAGEESVMNIGAKAFEIQGERIAYSDRPMHMPPAFAGHELAVASNVRAFDIHFSKPIAENIKLSLPALKGDTKYQAVFNKKGEVVGGKYNPVTNTIDVKINKGDTYIVKENKVDFSDIKHKSKEMQEAIRILASKGIINGVGKGKFNPDGTISRAEIATLFVKTLSKYDAKADGKFKDVLAKDWFFGAVGSAKRHGLMNGTSEITFAPRDAIKKDQIVAVSARVLKTEMKYKVPAETGSILAIYRDFAEIADWAVSDVALATRENLVVKRYDGKFVPLNTMTRGDVAIILYRLFKKLW